MSFISESQLSNYRIRTKTFSKDNIAGLHESSSRDKAKPMIFLSHKHDEASLLQDVIAFLKNEGVDIYVDWMDEDMPVHTSAETASRLKEKIKKADKFILLATQEAINSKWCNWELGLGDAAKYIENIALFPINRTYQSFSGSEYLGIYPRIEYQDGTTTYTGGNFIPRGYYVIYPAINGSSTIYTLKYWLTK